MKLLDLIKILESINDSINDYDIEVEFEAIKFPSLGIVLLPYERYKGEK